VFETGCSQYVPNIQRVLTICAAGCSIHVCTMYIYVYSYIHCAHIYWAPCKYTLCTHIYINTHCAHIHWAPQGAQCMCAIYIVHNMYDIRCSLCVRSRMPTICAKHLGCSLYVRQGAQYMRVIHIVHNMYDIGCSLCVQNRVLTICAKHTEGAHGMRWLRLVGSIKS